jgi:hypothetical protein
MPRLPVGLDGGGGGGTNDVESQPAEIVKAARMAAVAAAPAAAPRADLGRVTVVFNDVVLRLIGRHQSGPARGRR